MIEFIGFILYCVLVVIPFFKLLPSYGLNPYWAVVTPTVIGLIVLLWVMASRVDQK